MLNMNKLCPEKVFNKFLPRSSVSKYNTRHYRDLQIPRYRTEFPKKGFHYSALKAWNDLPAKLRELPTQNSFKKQLKTYLKGWTQKLTHEYLEDQRLFIGLSFYFELIVILLAEGMPRAKTKIIIIIITIMRPTSLDSLFTNVSLLALCMYGSTLSDIIRWKFVIQDCDIFFIIFYDLDGSFQFPLKDSISSPERNSPVSGNTFPRG